MNPFFKHQTRLSFFTFLFFMISIQLHAQQAGKSFWKEKSENKINRSAERAVKPSAYRTLSLDVPSMKKLLKRAPKEAPEGVVTGQGIKVNVPMPDGTMQRFNMVETEVMHPDLARAYPFIKTYSGQGIDDPTALARFDVTQFGFHSMIMSPKGMMFIEPYTLGNTGDYICYDKKHSRAAGNFICETDSLLAQQFTNQVNHSAQRSSGTQLRTYRLALACTGEYAAYYGGTKSGALAGIVTSINRCDGVYEQEVGIRMVLIPNDTLIIYTNAATDPYTNTNGSTMLGQNQTTCDGVIGSANYDIGHVFSTGGGGVAYLGCVCGSSKAGGVTGSGAPIGDAYDIDYVVHEMGHQFGANHTFNSTTGSCGGGNRSAGTAYEPGSGITIMAYAGICGADNLDPHSIAYFHTVSFDEINTYSTTGNGNTCPVTTSSGNTAPVVTSMGYNCSIPISTPFMLTGSGSDANGDPITYSWEEFDLGTAGAWNANPGDAPLFRPFSPVSSGYRTFPQLSDIINNTTTIGEILPTLARTMHFRLTVRDNKMGGGGVMHPDTTVSVAVVNSGGAFAVTAPNTAVTWGTGTIQTVTWTVNGTTNTPISCANVKISLSTDGGYTFPTVLLASTPNDGTENVVVPNAPTTQARIKVEAVGNIFFDMSNVNFTITLSSAVLTTITTSALSTNSYCAGNAVNVPFAVDGPANAGNIFTAQLSNAAGSFSSPVNIGTLAATSGGTIAATIPGGTAVGSGYRIRVISSNPVVTGSDNGSNVSVFNTPGAAGIITGTATVCQGQTGVVYSVAAVVNATGYSWTLPAGGSITAGTNTNSITVSYSASASSGNVSVYGLNAGCNGSSSPAFAVTVNSLPLAAGSITGTASVCQNQAGVVYSVPVISGATGYNWTLPSGTSITAGTNTNSITVSFSSGAVSGNVTVAGSNTCGSGTASNFAVSVSPAPAAAVVTAGGSTTFCSGGSVSLSFTAGSGISYQWRKDGVNISGATTSPYTATVAGSYDVVSTSSSISQQTFSNNTPVKIPDNTCTNPAIDSITVSGYSGTVSSSGITVKINITHTWDGDLDMILEAPNGNKLGLCYKVGSSGDNFTNTIFSDAGATVTPSTGAPYTNTYKPWASTFTGCVTSTITSFASIAGGTINPNGIWKLHVHDGAASDTGRVQNWSITFPFHLLPVLKEVL
ncbi:MAG: M12 family metallo-peptidase [Bacteroidetes bacterium]|nr:M12 family metallo-peptidase [Bacteroidota bacterium]